MTIQYDQRRGDHEKQQRGKNPQTDRRSSIAARCPHQRGTSTGADVKRRTVQSPSSFRQMFDGVGRAIGQLAHRVTSARTQFPADEIMREGIVEFRKEKPARRRKLAALPGRRQPTALAFWPEACQESRRWSLFERLLSRDHIAHVSGHDGVHHGRRLVRQDRSDFAREPPRLRALIPVESSLGNLS